MHGNHKHRAYPFEKENVSSRDKKKKKRDMKHRFRRMEKRGIEKLQKKEDLESFEEPDLGYHYMI